MQYLDQRIIWTRTLEVERVLRENDLFDMHYTVYEFKEDSSSVLLSHSFQTGPSSRSSMGFLSSPFISLLTGLLDGKYTVFYGQKSIWKAVQYGRNGVWTRDDVVM